MKKGIFRANSWKKKKYRNDKINVNEIKKKFLKFFFIYSILFLASFYHRGISSNGRALALHARGTGIDTRILHYIASLSFSYQIEKYKNCVYPLNRHPR